MRIGRKSSSIRLSRVEGDAARKPDQLPYTKIETHVNPNDVVILMTDGLPELFNEKGEIFGYKRVFDLIRTVAHKSPNDNIDDMNNAARAWLNGSKQDDDVTYFVFRRKRIS